MLSEAEKNWLRHGERGISSETIFETMTDIPLVPHYWFSRHPYDPDDFQRCEKLLRSVPEFRTRLDIMKTVSPVWSSLVDHWGQIVELFESECPGLLDGKANRGSAPKTYELMKSLGC